MRAEPSPHHPPAAAPPAVPLLGAPVLAVFALGAPGGCWDLLGRLWSARPAGRIAGCPCWALCEACGACERREQVTEVLCVSAAGTGPRAARLSPANELGVLRACACAHSCPVPQRSKPQRRDAVYLPLEAAEQSPFSSGCWQLRAAPAAWQTGAGSAASAQAARAEGGGWLRPQTAPGPAGGGKGQVGGLQACSRAVMLL